jgi:hypothetical protein
MGNGYNSPRNQEFFNIHGRLNYDLNAGVILHRKLRIFFPYNYMSPFKTLYTLTIPIHSSCVHAIPLPLDTLPFENDARYPKENQAHHMGKKN